MIKNSIGEEEAKGYFIKMHTNGTSNDMISYKNRRIIKYAY